MVGMPRERYAVAAIAVTILIVLLSPFFAYAFEPLELVAERYGAEEEAIYEAPMPDYTVPGLPEGEGGIVSGIVGTLIVLAAAYAVGQAVKGRGEG